MNTTQNSKTTDNVRLRRWDRYWFNAVLFTGLHGKGSHRKPSASRQCKFVWSHTMALGLILL